PFLKCAHPGPTRQWPLTQARNMRPGNAWSRVYGHAGPLSTNYDSPMRGLNWLDFVVIGAYLAGITALGIFVGRRQRDSKDYFVAGREIPWWAVMFSVVASETSALTFISTPGLAYATNLGFLQIACGYLLGRIVVAYTLLPRYYEGGLVTAYALLEKRFGLAARRFTSIVFMVTRGLADSVRVFATAIPIALILEGVIAREYVMPTAVLILGTLTIIYTYR